MQGSSRRLDDLAFRRLGDEAGFAMIEVMVSAVLLIVLALATLSVIDKSQQTSSNNRSRDVAAQIAQNEQNKIRQMPMAQLAGGLDTTDYIWATEANNTFKYTAHSVAEWVTDSGGPVTCSTSGTIAYLQTSTSVTWPGMGSIKPVTADAIVDPGVAALGADKGALTVLLSKADGTGTPGITVTADGQSAVTDENGCAVIGNLDIGPQTLTYSDNAHVDKDSIQPVSKPVSIGAGTIAQATGYYDHPGILTMSFVDDADNPATWPTKVSLDHAQHTSPTTFLRDVNAAKTGATTALFPFSSPYKAYVGECAGNDPANALYGGAPQGALITAGQPSSLNLRMPRVTVKLGNGGAGARILVAAETNAPSMSGCPVSTYSNSASWVANASGTANIALPYGVWTICAVKGNSGSYQQVKSVNTWPRPNNLANGAAINTPATSGNYKANLTTDLTGSSWSNVTNSAAAVCS